RLSPVVGTPGSPDSSGCRGFPASGGPPTHHPPTTPTRPFIARATLRLFRYGGGRAYSTPRGEHRWCGCRIGMPEAVSSSASGPMLGAGSGLLRCAPRRTRALEVSEMPRVLVPLVSLAVLLSSSPVAAQDQKRSPERWQQLARELLAELVAIN